MVPLLFLLMWSSGAFFVKLGLAESSVWTFLAIRSAGAMGVLAVVFIALFRSDLRASLTLPRRTILSAVAVGLLLQAIYQGAYFLAIANQLSPGTLTIILGAQPLLMPLIARERLPWTGRVLLLAGFAGLVLAVAGARELGAGSMEGVVFGGVALVALTAGSALQKRIGAPVAQSILWQYLGSVVVFGVIVLFTGWRVVSSPGFVFAATWMILVVSVGANVLLIFMMSRRDISKISVVFYFVPIVTMMGERVIYKTSQSAATLSGAAIVVLSSLAFAKLDALHRYVGRLSSAGS